MTQAINHPVYRNYKEMLEAVGAVLRDWRDARTGSDYAVLECGQRQVIIRGSDHLNVPNPTTSKTARRAYMLRYTARGFDRALALWLGWDEQQLRWAAWRGGSVGTKKWVRYLASQAPAHQVEEGVTQ